MLIGRKRVRNRHWRHFCVERCLHAETCVCIGNVRPPLHTPRTSAHIRVCVCAAYRCNVFVCVGSHPSVNSVASTIANVCFDCAHLPYNSNGKALSVVHMLTMERLQCIQVCAGLPAVPIVRSLRVNEPLKCEHLNNYDRFSILDIYYLFRHGEPSATHTKSVSHVVRFESMCMWRTDLSPTTMMTRCTPTSGSPISFWFIHDFSWYTHHTITNAIFDLTLISFRSYRSICFRTIIHRFELNWMFLFARFVCLFFFPSFDAVMWPYSHSRCRHLRRDEHTFWDLTNRNLLPYK